MNEVVGPPPAANSRLVTLIHGTEPLAAMLRLITVITRAKNAPWTRAGSHFQKNLASKLEGNTEFLEFPWTRKNSFRARNAAADALKEHIREQIRLHPGVPHYVIAHSHGGNIALQALSDPSLSNAITGLVCLSTPFLNITPRRWSVAARWVLPWGAAVATIIIWFESSDRLASYLSSALRFPLIATQPGRFLVALAILFLISPIVPWVESCVTAVKAAMRPTGLPPDRVLIIKKAGDEALELLGGFRFLTRVVGTLWTPLAKVYDHCHSALCYEPAEEQGELHFRPIYEHFVENILPVVLGYAVLLLCIAALLMSGVKYAYPAVQSLFVQIGGRTVHYVAFFCFALFLFPFLFPLAATILYALLVLPFALAMGVCLCPVFGPEMLVAAVLYDVAVNATPAGDWRIRNLTDDTLNLHKMSLAHSTHSDSETQAAIIDWICSL